jgi:hypothetical protein
VAGYDIGPSGAQFAKPVTVTIAHQAGQNITACWYDPATDSFSQDGITDVNTVSLSSGLNATTFKTTHFTQFYIFDLGEDGGEPIECISGGGGGCTMVKDGVERPSDLFVPFVVLAMVMATSHIWDRRKGRA